MKNSILEFRTGTKDIDWPALFNLYEQVGLVAGHGKKRESHIIKKSFENSSKVVTAWFDKKLVGAGRLLTDGLCYGCIFDVGVLPAYQKKGVGKRIVKELLNGTESLCIHLTSTFGSEGFYSRLGFKKHKTAMAKYPYESDYLEAVITTSS